MTHAPRPGGPLTRPFPTRPLQFYLTAPSECPYLPDRLERKIFAHLDAADGGALNDALTHAGFRRSQGIIYRPACEGCEACLSARVIARAFTPSRGQSRTLKRNADLERRFLRPEPTEEQYELLSRYLAGRHAGGGMAGMGFADYAMMVADTPADTRVVEYRDPEGALAAAALVDRLSDGFSLVYSFFEPEQTKRSLGAFMILDHIAQARVLGAPYVYLGYWVGGSAKMDYKARYQPLEVLRRGGWRRMSATDATLDANAKRRGARAADPLKDLTDGLGMLAGEMLFKPREDS